MNFHFFALIKKSISKIVGRIKQTLAFLKNTFQSIPDIVSSEIELVFIIAGSQLFTLEWNLKNILIKYLCEESLSDEYLYCRYRICRSCNRRVLR